MDVIRKLDFHRGRNEQLLYDYYIQLRLELSKNVINKKVIYLDTKFWVLLRDGFLYPEKNTSASELLKLSKSLSENEKCIFPISEDVFMEVMKQTDSTTLKETVDLIDKLSNGITLLSFDERFKLEILHFFDSAADRTVYETKKLVWSKLPYNAGFYSFRQPSLSVNDNLELQKAHIEQLWNMSLLQMIEEIQGNAPNVQFSQLFNMTYADILNEGKFSHQHEANNFQQMFMSEVAGMVEAYKEDLADMMEFICDRKAEKTFSEQEIKKYRDETVRLMQNAITNIFRFNKAGKMMPTIRISAALYAAVRWDKKQNFQDHDFYDFRHATAALPYCDFFFTEKRLAHLLTQNLLGFDKFYQCNIQTTVSGAISCF